MIEIIENAIQLVTTGICTAVSLRKGILLKSRVWIILALASGVFFLGNLYWELFLVLYGKTPVYSYIPYMSWYACYLFLLLLLHELRNGKYVRRRRRILWVIPLFTTGMCIFYMQWGDWIGNVAAAVLMALLLWHAAEGLMLLREQKMQHSAECRGSMGIYVVIFLFCLAEYGSWTASCFWMGDIWMNPYFWFDTLLSAVFLLFPAALGKAVGR